MGKYSAKVRVVTQEPEQLALLDNIRTMVNAYWFTEQREPAHDGCAACWTRLAETEEGLIDLAEQVKKRLPEAQVYGCCTDPAVAPYLFYLIWPEEGQMQADFLFADESPERYARVSALPFDESWPRAVLDVGQAPSTAPPTAPAAAPPPGENSADRSRLTRWFARGGGLPYERWREQYAASPLAPGVLWGLYDEDDELLLACRCDEQGRLWDIDGKPAATRSGAIIGVAHPAQMGAEEPERWSELLEREGIEPVFGQLAEPVRLLAPELLAERYVDCTTRYSLFVNAYEHSSGKVPCQLRTVGGYIGLYVQFGDIHWQPYPACGNATGRVYRMEQYLDKPIAALTGHEKRLYSHEICKHDRYFPPFFKAEAAVRAGDLERVRQYLAAFLIHRQNYYQLLDIATACRRTEIAACMMQNSVGWRRIDDEFVL